MMHLSLHHVWKVGWFPMKQCFGLRRSCFQHLVPWIDKQTNKLGWRCLISTKIKTCWWISLFLAFTLLALIFSSSLIVLRHSPRWCWKQKRARVVTEKGRVGDLWLHGLLAPVTFVVFIVAPVCELFPFHLLLDEEQQEQEQQEEGNFKLVSSFCLICFIFHLSMNKACSASSTSILENTAHHRLLSHCLQIVVWNQFHCQQGKGRERAIDTSLLRREVC